MKSNLQRLNVDTSHWTGSIWSKNKQLKNYSDYSKSSRVKPHLIKERGHQCENCNNLLWCDKLIPLEIHHKNGHTSDNDKENLQLLCPNCHAQTDNWRRRKK